MPGPFPNRRLTPVIAEAKAARRHGQDTYVAGLELRDGAAATPQRLEENERELIAAVETVGWRYADSRTTAPWTVEYLFVRVQR